MRKRLAAPIAALALLAAACGSSSSSSSTSKSPVTAGTAISATSSGEVAGGVVIATRDVPGLGVVLVNGQGRTLYTFALDKARKVTCLTACASAWPPLFISAGQKPTTSGKVKAGLVATDPDPSGGHVVTYAGWPLYLYVADPTAGTAYGQSISMAGGLWYAISPNGKVITAKAAVGAGTSTSGGGGH